MSATPEAPLFVICESWTIARGAARAFSLWRREGDGEARPFPIVILRTLADEYLAYVNRCPHQGTWLNIGSGAFFTEDGRALRCGRHGAIFDIGTGICVDGPCSGRMLESVPVAVLEGDVCLCGIDLVEEDAQGGFFDEDGDETMEIMIHPG